MILTLIIGIIAFAYATVGHAGATGYIAVMTLFGISTDIIRPVALSLNIVVGVRADNSEHCTANPPKSIYSYSLIHGGLYTDIAMS